MVDLQALVIDFGGVLTTPVQDTMAAWCEADAIDIADFRQAMVDWMVAAAGDGPAANPVHALERGQLDMVDFERELAQRLHTRDGAPIEADGLLARMFAGFGMEDSMFAALRHARAAGVATALLSNSWGMEYPREDWGQLFDHTVISGEVRMRKPEPEIYRLTLDRLELDPAQCVFVDDLPANVDAAVAIGMVGIVHITPEQTLDALEGMFAIPLRG
jgi:putative hydrolase of the HAD superfamily